MTTTSGASSRQSSTTFVPSSTAPTTSMSSRRPSRSSRASRNTWLSSTSATRTGGGIGRVYPRLLGGKKQRVMRLPARMDLELDVGVVLGHAGEQRAELGL